ncbi:ABC transporter ATP-binding protein [bacterium]|nr:MAG: ABC transporter ATP-binding protein [bacterium]
MILLKNISKSFGGKVVLKEVNLTIPKKEHIALVGKNGSGKSTLLRILAGLLEPDDGKVENPQGLRVGYFPQEIPKKDQEQTGEQFFNSLLSLNKDKLYGEMGLFFKKLQFSPEKLKQKIEDLSGGEKSKILLMLILKSPADIFLLDEPTNNLDLRGLVVLEEFIDSSQKGFFIVSHDRKVLDRFVESVVEMNDQTNTVEIYHNYSYSEYLHECKMKEQRELDVYNNDQRERKRLEETILLKKQEARKMQRGSKKPRDKDKFVVGFKKDRSKKIASQASTIEKRLKRIKEINRPRQPLPLNLEFDLAERSGDIVFRLEKAKVNYYNFSVGPVDVEIHYGDRVVILGPNGGGKTTLLKLLIGEMKPDSGFNYIGSRVNIGYLSQEIRFNNQEKILGWFLKNTQIDETNVRRILARFGFLQEEVYSKIGRVSPGQRSRLILASLMARKINCLILDEPSNHLDIEVLDRLEGALKIFSGTIVMVSHDRYLIDQIDITKTYLIEEGRINPLLDYHEYQRRILGD